ncbi:MAG: hypothetical protein ABEJ25_02140 [Candidatus Bipolaricaulia bacterium]
MNEEREKILKMLDEGKVTVEEAQELLSTIDETEKGRSKFDTEVETAEEASALKINVVENGEEEVNISIPIGLVKMLKSFIPSKAKDKLDEKGINIDKILEEIEKGSFDGKLVDIENEATHIEIKLVK